MKIQFLYLISFLIYFSKGFSQDLIVKTDSSKIEAKILEIRTSEINYKLFNFQEGPLYVVSKSDIAYIVYANGIKEIFQISKKIDDTPVTPYISKDTIFTNPTPPKGSEKVHQARVGDYIKFNLQVGVVINNAFSNLTSRKPSPSHTSDEEFSGNNDEKYNSSINLGINFLFGNNPSIKHVIGINYLRSKGEFNYDYYSVSFGSSSAYTQYHESYQFKSTADFLNITTGLRFSIGKHINFEPLVAFNYLIKADERITGNITTHKYSGGQSSNGSTEIEYVNNEKVKKYDSKINSTVSLCPRISYDFNIKKHRIGLYASYNLAYNYILPWYMLGVTYYPFKKLSQSTEMKSPNSNDKKKLKVLHNPKISFDLDAVINNGYTNTDEAYSGKKPNNAKEYKLGYNFGLNFYHGKSSYFKHFILASLIESQAKLLKRTYNYTYDLIYTYETVNTTQYNSKVLFLNIGTGIKFIAFKHLYFDNGLALNIPIYATNEIQYDKTYNQWDKFYTNKINTTSEPTIKSKSNELLIKKINWIFLAKIGYEFNIKQNRFGVFVGWNYNLNRGSQWHMLGLSYYPFKKLR